MIVVAYDRLDQGFAVALREWGGLTTLNTHVVACPSFAVVNTHRTVILVDAPGYDLLQVKQNLV